MAQWLAWQLATGEFPGSNPGKGENPKKLAQKMYSNRSTNMKNVILSIPKKASSVVKLVKRLLCISTNMWVCKNPKNVGNFLGVHFEQAKYLKMKLLVIIEQV